MSRFIDGVHQLWYVDIYHNEVKVECKVYEKFWDSDWVSDCNAYHTREEAESAAEAVRSALKMKRNVRSES